MAPRDYCRSGRSHHPCEHVHSSWVLMVFKAALSMLDLRYSCASECPLLGFKRRGFAKSLVIQPLCVQVFCIKLRT